MQLDRRGGARAAGGRCGRREDQGTAGIGLSRAEFGQAGFEIVQPVDAPVPFAAIVERGAEIMAEFVAVRAAGGESGIYVRGVAGSAFKCAFPKCFADFRGFCREVTGLDGGGE